MCQRLQIFRTFFSAFFSKIIDCYTNSIFLPKAKHRKYPLSTIHFFSTQTSILLILLFGFSHCFYSIYQKISIIKAKINRYGSGCYFCTFFLFLCYFLEGATVLWHCIPPRFLRVINLFIIIKLINIFIICLSSISFNSIFFFCFHPIF